MKRHEEDEIQVLGQAGGGRKQGGGKRFLGYLLPALAVALLITGCFSSGKRPFLHRKTMLSPWKATWHFWKTGSNPWRA